MARPSVLERFWSKVQLAKSGCWEWTGGLCNGYGQFWTGQRTLGAHRYAYEMAYGPMPIHLETDHLCRNRKCVNPGHLEAVTRLENFLRGESFMVQRAAQTHCWRGHEFTAENTGTPSSGHRRCRACQAIHRKDWRKRKRAERQH